MNARIVLVEETTALYPAERHLYEHAQKHHQSTKDNFFPGQTFRVIDPLNETHFPGSHTFTIENHAASADATGSAILVTWLPARMIFWPAESLTNEMSLFSRCARFQISTSQPPRRTPTLIVDNKL
jgi:hypothetical protein